MNEDSARHLLLVRAIESEDAAEALLTREDRQHATAAGLGEQARAGSGKRADEAFLARRADFAYTRLATRFPAVAQACRRAGSPTWIDWALPLGALALGLATNEIDSGQRLNIIAFPLIGMLAWNLAVYVLLAVGALKRLGRGRAAAARPNLLARLLSRWAGPAQRHAEAQPALSRGLGRFARDWLRYSSKLTYSRASRTLHVSAAALAAGVLIGMYWRALGLEYRAGWESTFIEAPTLHWLLGFVLGPASLLTGIALPGLDQLDALRWTSGSRGVNAGPWIHLYATTALIFIIGPRLILAGWHSLRALRLRRRFPVPGTEDFYVRRLLRSARGGGSVVRVVPYSFHPPESARRHLQRVLGDALGDKTRVTIDTPIAYGEEDEWLARTQLGEDTDHLLVLFNLSATPEAENHGALVAGIQRRMTQANSGAGLAVLVDASAYRQRLAGQAGAEGRLETRRLAWERMLDPLGVQLLVIDLDGGDDQALVRRLEGALMHGPSLMQTGAPA